MNNYEIISNLNVLYISSLLVFSIFVALSYKKSTSFISIIWIFSNLTAALSMLAPSVFLETTYSGAYNFFSYVVSGISIILPYFALLGSKRRALRFRQSHIILVVGVAAMLTAAILPYGWLATVLGYSGGAVIVFVTAWVCYKIPLYPAFLGKGLLIFGLIACALLFLWRGWIVFTARDGIGFDINPANTALGLEMLIAISFCIQIGFLHMIIGRELRLNLLSGRRAARLFVGNKRMLEERKRLSDLADERFLTLGLLTHEVRQPINNARAALEALDHAIGLDNPKPAKSKLAIARAQGVLDSVTLAISNAIFAASFLEESTNFLPRTCDALGVAQLAKTDCPVDLISRIEGDFDGEPIYVDMDPVLVRLALRNLLDNALKYSPAQSAIQFCVHQRESLLGTSFTVTSQLKAPDLLDESIFMRNVRGSGAEGRGSGLGLYFVKKVGKAHGGGVSYFIKDGSTVTFDLFIPE